MTSEVFSPEYRFAENQLDWYNDRGLTAYLDRFGELDKTNAARRWMVRQLLRVAAAVPGDTVECGSFEGASSWLFYASNAGTPKIHHIFDSFWNRASATVPTGGAAAWPLVKTWCAAISRNSTARFACTEAGFRRAFRGRRQYVLVRPCRRRPRSAHGR